MKRFGDILVLEPMMYMMLDLIELSSPQHGSGLGFSPAIMAPPLTQVCSLFTNFEGLTKQGKATFSGL